MCQPWKAHGIAHVWLYARPTRRSIGLSFYLYADNNSNSFPLFLPEGIFAEQDDPTMPGYHFTTSDGATIDNFVCWMDLLYPYGGVVDIFRCPSAEILTTSNYGYNGWFGWYKHTKMDEIMYPSRLIMTLDLNRPWPTGWWDWRNWYLWATPENPDPSGMHGNNRMNVGFVDGHVEEVDRLDPEYFDDTLTHWTPRIYWHIIGGPPL